ncbi:MAG: ABC transporter permease [Oscillospiraceae bacterium]|nr:ABC transporter permease [Oscillospiraceae bacterium]MCL2277811.1 ABC transporter permease [Oscillospiraceae bacterium]
MKIGNLKLGQQLKDSLGLYIAIIALFIFLSFQAEGFFSWFNIHNVLRDFSILLIISCGMTIAIMLGKIDISAGSVMSLSTIVTSLIIAWGMPVFVGILGGLAAGAAVGFINGYLIGVQKLNHFVATFATLSIARGVSLVISRGDIIHARSRDLMWIGTGRILNIFVIIWVGMIVFALMYFFLRKTSFGYKIYSTGGSESIAELSGIKTKKVYVISFMIVGAMAALAGVLISGMTNSGNATVGDGFEFNAIAIVLIGGTPFDGGRGGVVGTFAGALFIALLRNGISMLGFTPSWQFAIIGVVILVVVSMSVLLNERRKREEMRRVWQ